MAGNETSIPEVFPQAVPAVRQAQTGTVRREFLEYVVIAMLSLAIGLALGAAICTSSRSGKERR
jgi:hypothetical protein